MVVYYESIKRELKTRPMYEYRCDERLKTRVEESTRLACTQLVRELALARLECLVFFFRQLSSREGLVWFRSLGV